MIKPILHQLSIWIIIIPLLVGIMNSKGLNKDSKWILYLVSIALIPQALTALLVHENTLLNLSYNLYTPIEFGVLYIIFYSKHRIKANRHAMKITTMIFLASYSYFLIEYGLEKRFLNELVCISHILYMLWILLLLKQEYSAESTLIIKQNPFTWYLFGTILYAPSTLIVFALYYFIRDPKNEILNNLWIIQSLSNILLYLLYAAGLLIRKTY